MPQAQWFQCAESYQLLSVNIGVTRILSAIYNGEKDRFVAILIQKKIDKAQENR